MSIESVIQKAIAEGRSIQIGYKDELRNVDPYVLGTTSSGNLTLRAYQQGDHEGWRLFTVDKIQVLMGLPTHFDVRTDYKEDDKGFVTIAARRKQE